MARKVQEGYPAWGSTPRLHRGYIVTEKIDGTNGLISIEVVDPTSVGSTGLAVVVQTGEATYLVRAGSRTRWLGDGQENHGFWAWVKENALTLVNDLGEGLHYGEWFGKGINSGYGLDEKYFALFNSHRWEGSSFTTPNLTVVPVLHKGDNAANLNEVVENLIADLATFGSHARPGALAEGIIIFHVASGQKFKVTIQNDEKPKSLVNA